MLNYELGIIKELKASKIYRLKNLTFGQRLKLLILTKYLKKTDRILDLGCGTMWLTKYLRKNGYHCLGFANQPPADIIGDIKNHHFKRGEFNVVIALETIEHVDCFKEIHEILNSQGLLIISTPVPHLDWVCLILEKLNLFQHRTSDHSNLFYLQEVPFQPQLELALFGLNQFGIYKNRKRQKKSRV